MPIMPNKDRKCKANINMKWAFLAVMIPGYVSLAGAQIEPVFPPEKPKPVSPYTPGVFAGDYLYVSGQGADASDGKKAADFEGQAEQAIKNVESVVRAAGLTLEHVVYVHVYLENLQNIDIVNRVFAKYFRHNPPARAVLGVAKLIDTPIEINAVAVRDLGDKKPVTLPGVRWDEPSSPAILTKDRLFVSAMRGRDLDTGAVPSDPADQVSLALEGMQRVLRAAGLDMKNMVFVNPYLTRDIPTKTMNKLYAEHFEFGNTPARATIQVESLPGGAHIEFTGVAVRDLSMRQAIRPKNMAPSPTASPCVFAEDTLYCSAKSGFIPGPNGGIFVERIDQQLRQTMRNLLDNLEEAGLDLQSVVATNVYLDNLEEFQTMNKIYAKYFKDRPPARTTVQQVKSVDRSPNSEGVYPEIEQISLIAFRSRKSDNPSMTH
jgi:reactive intermediate/imine deaminase